MLDNEAPVPSTGCSQTAAAHAEHVQLGCQITASCTLLGQAEFLQHYGAAAAHNLQGLVGEWTVLQTAQHTAAPAICLKTSAASACLEAHQCWPVRSLTVPACLSFVQAAW